MKTYEFNGYTVKLTERRYGNGTLAVTMEDHDDGCWEPYATITTNLDSTYQSERFAFLNDGYLPNLGRWLEENGIAFDTGVRQSSGYCTYKLYEFTFGKPREEHFHIRMFRKDGDMSVCFDVYDSLGEIIGAMDALFLNAVGERESMDDWHVFVDTFVDWVPVTVIKHNLTSPDDYVVVCEELYEQLMGE